MTRHGKNSTAGAVYTYHERKKDTIHGEYGSRTLRLGKDSIKGFDCCSLSLQPCRNPVITLDGIVYDKECILECLIHQKRKNAKQLKEYERQRKKHEEEIKEFSRAETRSKVAKFISTERSIVSKPCNNRTSEGATSEATGESSSSATNKDDEVKSKNELPSFWIPARTPDAKPTEVKKPDNKTFCPTSGKQLRVKDLIPIKFTLIADRDSKTAVIVKEARYMCPVTRDTLGNSIPCAVLKPSGDVVTTECVEKLIYKNGMQCPITGKILKENDIIRMSRGGTGFAETGVELKATKAGAAMMA